MTASQQKMEGPAPGLTETFGDPAPLVAPEAGALATLPHLASRRVILLSTATITEENIYSNGLFQNVFVFYRMFEAMGYAPILIVNERPKALKDIPEPLRRCRTIVTEDVMRSPPQNLLALMEIGMSLDPAFRQFVKMLGGRLIKVYLGNILNIDIETPLFLGFHYFAHHVVGRNDQILVSPHYGQHAEYASLINHVVPPKDLTKMIAPYVWDATILTREGAQPMAWKAPARSEDEVFVIMEPNISFQKCSLIPLLALERWYRDSPAAKNWKGRVAVVNGERLMLVPHFANTILKGLRLFQDGRVSMEGRMDVASVMMQWPSATFILHNYNNEYNYMTLELLWTGFPVVHNSPSWKDVGYYYEGADLATAAKQIQEIRDRHVERRESYKAHAATLAWRHSPYNPVNHAAWRGILENPVPE